METQVASRGWTITWAGIHSTFTVRLLRRTHDDLSRIATVSCGSIWSQSFGFDPFGNIRKTGSQSFTPTYSNSTNQINGGGYSQSYDANGNLLTINDGTTHTYTWDAEGKQLGIDSYSAIYDALGRMVELNSSGTYTETVYGLAGEKLALMNGQTLKNAFVATPSGTAVYVPTGLLYYRHADWLGSSRFASTTGRAMYSSSAYAPFGEQYAKAGTNDQNFTGQQPDTAAGLYDFLFRRLSQTQGRWISPDPSGLKAVTLRSPQSWNRYIYALNDPLRFIDRLGLDVYACNWGGLMVGMIQRVRDCDYHAPVRAYAIRSCWLHHGPAWQLRSPCLQPTFRA